MQLELRSPRAFKLIEKVNRGHLGQAELLDVESLLVSVPFSLLRFGLAPFRVLVFRGNFLFLTAVALSF